MGPSVNFAELEVRRLCTVSEILHSLRTGKIGAPIRRQKGLSPVLSFSELAAVIVVSSGVVTLGVIHQNTSL